MTLKFLGETEVAVDSIADAIRTAVSGLAPFPLTLGGVGAFPSPSRARVLWIGATEGAKELEALAVRIDEAVHALGFELEARPFTTHLTIARTPRSIHHADARSVCSTGASEPLGSTMVREVTLFQSVLQRAGAVHTPMAVVPLTRT